MEEEMGTIIVDGKMYNLKDLSTEQLQGLEKKLEEKEKIYQEKILKQLKKK